MRTRQTVIAAVVLLLLLCIVVFFATRTTEQAPQRPADTTPPKTVRAAPSMLPLPPQPPNSIRLQAYIDGRSRLHLRGNTAQWYHLEFAAPGTHGNANKPTIINDKKWFPAWIDPGPFAAVGLDSVSDEFNEVSPSLPQTPVTVSIKTVHARGVMRVIQQPAADNSFTAIIEFDDSVAGGPADYVVDLCF